MTRERNKPTESWIERAKYELANEKELTIARAYELGRIRGYKDAVAMAKEWLKWNAQPKYIYFDEGQPWIDNAQLLSDFEAEMKKLWEEKK